MNASSSLPSPDVVNLYPIARCTSWEYVLLYISKAWVFLRESHLNKLPYPFTDEGLDASHCLRSLLLLDHWTL